MAGKKKQIKVIPLGGVGEIGKNMTAIEYGGDIIIVDCGMSFPEDYMLGIDAVIPDFTYLEENKDRILGLIITHGHDDHVGAIPYLLKKLNIPVYATRLTLGLISNKIGQHGIKDANLITVKAKESFELGCFRITPIKVNHSVADSVAYSIRTPVGVIVFTGDFKVDYTPVDDEIIDLASFAAAGTSGVLALFMDSTNVEREGYTMSERTVGAKLESIFANTDGRIIVTTFASNVHRIQQIIDASIKNKRKVCVMGFSMKNVVKIAMELGYMHCPESWMIDIDRVSKQPANQVTIITTGSQGEPMSALARMATSDYKSFNIMPGDTVIISATPVPGNEKMVSGIINKLFDKGANVIYNALADIHVSGHACKEELKLIYSLVKPKYFVPMHGEQRHLVHHAKMVEDMGMDKKNIIIPAIGKTICIDTKGISMGEEVHAGMTFVDGLGVGDVGNVVLKDRQVLSEDGLIIVMVTMDLSGRIISGPEILSRGFVYVKESEALMTEIREIALSVLQSSVDKKVDFIHMRNQIRERVKTFIFNKTQRRPMIMPVIMEAQTSNGSKQSDFDVFDFVDGGTE